MSIEAFTWALDVPVGGNAKVVLLGLANHAHPDGTESYPALDTLARYAHCDRSTARRNINKLVEDGWAILDGLGPRGQNKYRLPLERGLQNATGGKMPRVAPAPPGGGKTPLGGVAPVQPEPSIEPSKEPLTHDEASLFDDPSNVVHMIRPAETISPKTVDRRTVTLSEFVLADKVLTEWNRQAGQDKRADGYRAKIIMRIREHPEVTFEQHAEIIRRNLLAPWWKGDPDPAVVYGNDAQFERAMQCDGKPRDKQSANARIRDVVDRVARGEVG